MLLHSSLGELTSAKVRLANGHPGWQMATLGGKATARGGMVLGTLANNQEEFMDFLLRRHWV